MSDQPKPISDPANYRRLSEPFPSMDALNDALVAFSDEVRELRNKHKIRDVIVIVAGSYLNKDGEEVDGLTYMMHGASDRQVAYLAEIFGRAQAEQDEIIGRLRQGGMARAKARK
jgi:hypothetical protein